LIQQTHFYFIRRTRRARQKEWCFMKIGRMVRRFALLGWMVPALFLGGCASEQVLLLPESGIEMDRGRRIILEGEEMIEEGRDRVEDGDELIEEGRDMIKAGKERVREGERVIEAVEKLEEAEQLRREGDRLRQDTVQ
jgi:hypothetical protein